MKAIKRSLASLTLVIGQLVLLSGCGSRPTSSKLDTVNIPQTPIENQEQVGFCWAYATMGLIESQNKLATGQDVVLSPEALGFYRMVEGLYQLTRMNKVADILAELKGDDFQGFWVIADDRSAYSDAMSLLQVYGVVPEEIWSYKFETSLQAQTLVATLKVNLGKLVMGLALQGKDASGVTRDDIIKKVMVGDGAFPSAPPRNFQAPGTSTFVSSVDYMRNTLKFAPETYGIVEATNLQQLNNLIAAFKRSVVRGTDAVLSFPVNFDRLHGSEFTGAGVDLTNGANFSRDGGHAVLITDFVNTGSQAGALPADQIEAQLQRPSSDIDHVVIKNSWGHLLLNQNGQVVQGGDGSGYYTMDYPYMEGSAQAADAGLQVVVPNDIASNPFGAEPVNAKVAAQ